MSVAALVAYLYAPQVFIKALQFVVIGGMFGGVATAVPVLVIVLNCPSFLTSFPTFLLT